MRKLREFSSGEWLCGLPFQHALKQLRNDVVLALYKKQRPPHLNAFLNEVRALRGKNIALVVAFEQPWALAFLLRMAQLNLKNTTVLVFDNSLKLEKRLEIEAVCKQYAAPYLSLPKNATRHVNRSHGMAMSWIYDHVVHVIKPTLFAYLDHDLIPIKPIDFAERLVTHKQKLYGLLKASNKKMPYWQLWAGYCIYEYAEFSDKKLNFLYDFSRGIDTGGRNWRAIHRQYDKNSLKFAHNEQINMRLPNTGEEKSVQVIDGCWFHIGSISYNNNFATKAAFSQGLANALAQGLSWDALRADKISQV